jgi:hypothetical protein
VLSGAGFLIFFICISLTLAIQDRRDKALAEEIERTQSELLVFGDHIMAIKDADLTTMNDYIGAFAQIEPFQKEYEEKLQKRLN